MPRNRSLTKGRWRAYALSILLHAGIVAAAVYGWFTWKHSAPPVSTLAIEATVVDERVLKGIASKPEPPPPEPVPEPAPEPEPAPVEEQGPPKPDPAELERKEAERLALEKQQKQRAGAKGRARTEGARRRRARRGGKTGGGEGCRRKGGGREGCCGEKGRREKARGRRRCREEGCRRKGACRAPGGTSAVARGRRAGQCRPQQRRGHALARSDSRENPAGVDQASLGTSGHLLYCVGHPGSGRRGDSRPRE